MTIKYAGNRACKHGRLAEISFRQNELDAAERLIYEVVDPFWNWDAFDDGYYIVVVEDRSDFDFLADEIRSAYKRR